AASNGNGGFPGSQDTGRRLDGVSGTCYFPGDGGKKTAEVFRLAFHFGSEKQDTQLKFSRFLGGSVDQETVICDHVIVDILENRISGLGSVRYITPRSFLK